MANPVLEWVALSKSYRKTRVLDSLSLAVSAGELVGFIGPNGSGKSTALKVVAGLVSPDAGTVRIAGHDLLQEPMAAKRNLGFAPQDMALSPFLTGEEFLAFVAEVRGVDRVTAKRQADDLFERFELDGARGRLTREYSEGMARKLTIAAAVIGTPPVILLDETLNGLDPQSAWRARELLRELCRAGSAVVLTTHILPLVQELATRVAMLHAGRWVMELNTAQLADLATRGATLEEVYLEQIGFDRAPYARSSFSG